MVDQGLDAVASVTGFIDSAVAAGHATAGAIQGLDGALLGVRGGLDDLRTAGGAPVAAVVDEYIDVRGVFCGRKLAALPALNM